MRPIFSSTCSPDCAVCSEGYARGFGNTCSQCTDERRRIAIALLAIVSVVVMAIVMGSFWFLPPGSGVYNAGNPPANQRRKSAAHSFRKARAFQALKIVVVAWQIISQASCSTPFCSDSFSILIYKMRILFGQDLSMVFLLSGNTKLPII